MAKSKLPKKTKLWKIDAIADNTLEPNQAAVIEFYVAAATIPRALDKIDPLLQEKAKTNGMTPGDYDIQTEETLIGEVYF
jgi:hypothetical protein